MWQNMDEAMYLRLREQDMRRAWHATGGGRLGSPAPIRNSGGLASVGSLLGRWVARVAVGRQAGRLA